VARKRLQNKVAGSRFALPVTAAFATLAWAAGRPADNGMYLQFVLFAVSALLMVTLNNSNSLIRIYSRMVSCTFLVLTTMTALLSDSWRPFAVQLCLTASYMALFACYQDKRARGKMFYAFFFIGLASTLFIHILFFVPLLWLIMPGKLMAFSHKMFWASVLGLAAPYWFLSGYCLLTGNMEWLADHLAGIASLRLPGLPDLPDTAMLITTGFVFILAATGTVHYLRNSYGDKIRTRMIYEILMIMNVFTALFIIVQPQYSGMLLPLMAVNTAPLTAHFIALTSTRLTNISFCIITISAVSITAYNIWMQ